jgi:hypothetical protein
MPDLVTIQMWTVVRMDLGVLRLAGERLQQLRSLNFSGTYFGMHGLELTRIIDAYPQLRHFHLGTEERQLRGLDYSDMLYVMQHVNDNWYGRNPPLESMSVYHDTLSIVEPSERSREASQLAVERLDDHRRSSW